jgi:hypothetical protein
MNTTKNCREVYSVNEIKLLDAVENAVVHLAEKNRGGVFMREQNTPPFPDPYNGILVESNTQGFYWKRVFDEPINVKWFEAMPNSIDLKDRIYSIWNIALSQGWNIYFPTGKYELSYYFPWRQTNETAVVSLLDCKNITILGDGQNTVFSTNTPDGCDVFQLNAIKNLHFKGLKITARLTSLNGAGSNGVSITNGFDNLTFDQIYFEDLPRVERLDSNGSYYIDGGKAFTIQNSATAKTEEGLIKANFIVRNCAMAFNVDCVLPSLSRNKTAIDINMIAEDCYIGVVIVAAESPSPLLPGIQSGIRVRGETINCAKDLVLNRAHGVDIDLRVSTNTTLSTRVYSQTQGLWFRSNQVVESLVVQYAKNSRIVLSGNKGDCHYKAQIGSTTPGASGLSGATENCSFYLDISGNAIVSSINDAISNQGSMYASTLHTTATTVRYADIPKSFKDASNRNTIIGTY